MRKLILILMTTLLIACQQTTPDKTEIKDPMNNKGVYTEEIYTIKSYNDDNNNYDYGIFVCRDTYDDGTQEYSVYFNLTQSWDNHFSLKNVTLTEEDISYIFEFLDRCENYQADSCKTAHVAFKYKISEDALLVYSKGSLRILTKGDSFLLEESLSDLRNLMAGAKQRLEQLKKEDEQTKRKSK